MRKVFEVDEKDMANRRKYSGGLLAEFSFISKLEDPGCIVQVEDFPSGTVTARLGYKFEGEVHIVISGKAEIEYATTFGYGDWKKKRFIAEPGDAYLIDRGDQVSFKVLGEETYRHLNILMPAPAFAAEPKPENQPK